MFREFQVWKFWNFLSITVFRGLNRTKHCNAQKNQHFTASRLTKLEQAVFRGLNLTKHCIFQALKTTKHCNAQKFQNLKESATGLAIDARILEFFEHCSVS